MCKVSSKSVRSHFPNLRKNPRFSLTTALNLHDSFIIGFNEENSRCPETSGGQVNEKC